MRLNIERLQRYIEEQGYTQTQFASLTGLDQPAVSRILNGRMGVGMVLAERILLSMPVELWPELLVFSDGRSVFRVYEDLKRKARSSMPA